MVGASLSVADGDLETSGPDPLAGGNWDPFTRWVKRFVEESDFDEAQRLPRLRVAEGIQSAQEALKNGADTWPDLLRLAIAENQLVHQQATADLLGGSTAQPGRG